MVTVMAAVVVIAPHGVVPPRPTCRLPLDDDLLPQRLTTSTATMNMTRCQPALEPDPP
jgi:hypothetical protein